MTEQQLNQGQEQQAEQTPQELTLGAWDTLTEEQQGALKESLLKSKYGIGGEHFSTFPTLLDNKVNTWVEDTYKISKLPKRVQEQTFKQWEANGTLQILPILKGDKVTYLLTFLPNKQTKLDTWELTKDGENYLEYTTHNLLGGLTFTKEHYHILNGYTNKNKAYNQGKALTKLLKLGTNFQTLELQKELKTNYLELTINGGKWELKEIGHNSHKPTGNTYTSLEEYLGRKQHKKVTINYLENIQ